MFASFGGWLTGLVLYLRMPRLPAAFWVGVLSLVAVALCTLANPGFVRASGSWELIPMGGSVAGLPSTVDLETSLPAVVHMGALLAALVVVADLCSVREVRWLFLKIVALCGLLVAAIGVLQKAGESEAMLWATPEQSGEVFFGAFRYHTNAAAFLALSWPASFALWIRSSYLRDSPVARSLWFVTFFFTWIALFVNTSKIGHLVGLSGMIVAVFLFRKTVLRRPETLLQQFLSVLLLFVAGVVAVYPAFSEISTRWTEAVTVGGSWSGRMEAYRTCWAAISDGGIWGYGPGTFSLVFPYFAESAQGPGGFWRYAHQDYLQILVEWGWGGFLAFALVVFGGIAGAWRLVRRCRLEGRKEISQTCCLLALGSVLLIAAVDFPLQIPAVQLLFVVYLAGCWSSRKQTAPEAAC